MKRKIFKGGKPMGYLKDLYDIYTKEKNKAIYQREYVYGNKDKAAAFDRLIKKQRKAIIIFYAKILIIALALGIAILIIYG
jgi:hypothetical protein